MEINLRLRDVLNLNQTLKVIIDNEKDVDPLFKFKLLGIMKSLEVHVANFEIIRNEKIQKYGTEKDGSYSISPTDNDEGFKKFNEELSSVINSDVEVNITKLKASEVFDKGVSSEYLVGLYSIIEEE
jgi:hypothetical protein